MYILMYEYSKCIGAHFSQNYMNAEFWLSHVHLSKYQLYTLKKFKIDFHECTLLTKFSKSSLGGTGGPDDLYWDITEKIGMVRTK